MTMNVPAAWISALRKTEVFAELDEAVLRHLSKSLEEKGIAAGEYLVRQGDEGHSLFVVVSGELEVLLEGDGHEVVLHQLGPGSVVGEIALLVGGTRSASIRAVLPSVVLELPRERFEAVIEEQPAVVAPFTRVLRERMRRVKIAGHLEELLGGLTPALLRELEREVKWVHLQSGQELFKQGDDADGAYIVAVGRLQVSLKGRAGVDRVIEDVGPGEWIGEMALLMEGKRSATVYAVRDSELVWLSQDVFDRFIRDDAKALLATTRALVARVQRHMSPERKPKRRLNTIAIVPASDDVRVGDLARDIARCLSGYGSVLYLDANAVDEALGKKGIAGVAHDDPANLRLLPWLLEQEGQHRFVVYEADGRWSGWTDRTLRHADHVFVVADGKRGPRPTVLEQELAKRFEGDRAPKISLVLLQTPGRNAFTGTAAWLAARRLDGHFHVRQGVPGDVARLVRILTGNAICLVLGGGGSRGYAHIGVLRGFEQLGIPIDVFGGTSIGAVIGGMAALGMSAAEILAHTKPIFAPAFSDPTLPVVSFMSAKRLVDGLQKIGKGYDIEDAVAGYFCISTNLTRGGEVVHRRGSAMVAVRASSSVPGLFPPVPYAGDLLVDGGLSNNVPVDTMAALYGGAIVAVDVMPEVDLLAAVDLPISLSGWRAAWQSVNPFGSARGIPSIVSIMVRAVTTASSSLVRAEASARLAALYLKPPVDKWNVLDFRAAAPIADQGYAGTFKAIDEWWQRDGDRLMGRRRLGGDAASSRHLRVSSPK